VFSPRNLSNRGAPEARGASPGAASFSIRFTQRIAPNGVCCLVGHRRRRHPFYGEIGISAGARREVGEATPPSATSYTAFASSWDGACRRLACSGAVPSGATVKLLPLYTGSRLNRPATSTRRMVGSSLSSTNTRRVMGFSLVRRMVGCWHAQHPTLHSRPTLQPLAGIQLLLATVALVSCVMQSRNDAATEKFTGGLSHV
jgi:hypothetical protein